MHHRLLLTTMVESWQLINYICGGVYIHEECNVACQLMHVALSSHDNFFKQKTDLLDVGYTLFFFFIRNLSKCSDLSFLVFDWFEAHFFLFFSYFFEFWVLNFLRLFLKSFNYELLFFILDLFFDKKSANSWIMKKFSYGDYYFRLNVFLFLIINQNWDF